MKRLWLLVWLFAGAILAGTATVCAQGAATPLSVDEAKARAVLDGDVIHLQIPFSVPARTAGRAAVRVISPKGTVSAETIGDFVAGARIVGVELPWPKDNKGKRADEVGWYRIGYRVEAATEQPLKGVLSVGAIAPNLLTLRLALPQKPVTGKPLTVRVYAGNPVTRRAFRGVLLEGTLEYDGEPVEGAKPFARTIVRQAITGSSGEGVLTYPLEGSPGDTATLTVKGVLTGGDRAQATSSIYADVEISDRKTIHIDTDKPLHKPGEVVHLRALVFEDSGHASAGSALKLTIKDPDSKTLLEAALTTNRFGIASYDWKTGPQLAPGDYFTSFDLAASSDHSGSGAIAIAIRRYDLPEFSVSAATDRGFYLDGQTPVIRLHAGYLFGKPVAAGSVRVVRAEGYPWNRRGRKAEEPEKVEQTATLDEHGDTELKLNIAEDFTDFKDTEYQRYRDIEYRAYVTDATTGRSEPRNFTVRLSHYAVHIYLNKMGGNDREGDYIVNAAYADGAPAACKVSLDWMDADSRPSRTAVVTTNRYGLARVHLRYPSAAPGAGQTFNLRLTARDAEQRTSLFDDMLNADDAKTIWISVAATLMKPGQNIEATLHGQVGSTIDVDAVAVSGVINHQQVHMMHAAEPISVLMGDDFRGLVTLMAYSLNNDVDRFSYGFFRWGGFKSVLYPEDRQLKLKLAGLRTSYAPGAAVDAGIDVRAAGDFAAPSALEVSVIDTAVEQRAATEEDANQRLSSWSWWRDESNIAGVTWEDLVKRDSSQPIPDDLQLAAEAGLQYNIPFQLAIESEDYDDVRNDLNALMRKALKPVGDAILAARPVRLPATLDGVHAITIAANLDAAVLLDPWDTPYRVQSAVEWNDEVVSMVSAGPDKRFGTADDFTIDVARRNLFALPGERLIGLLKDAVAVDQPLPGTVEALKQLTLAQGLDLDAIFDPDGKSFLYGIEVGPRHYTVRVSRVGGAPVWNTPFVDYFSHSEARMQVALNEWTSMGKPFPATEAEVRAAFSAAGIDLDGLRDPLGRAFELRIVQLMSYTRVEKVTAGTRSQETSRPVTQQYLAIQVMQPGSGPDQGNVPQVVAQFLHPITRQGGSDAKPVPIAAGTFKGNTGAIGGTITDPSGAAIQGAVATVKNADGAAVAAVNSGADGTYLVPNLNPALYTVEIAARGFQQSTIEEVRVAAVALTTVDVELKVGAASETVTVTDAPPMLNTTDASLGGTVVGFARTPGGKVTISEQSFTPRLRHVFEETAFWAPSIETSPGGHAAFHFNLPDSLTTWKLHALASTTDGRIGEVEQTFKTFQPFFVDLDVPQVLTAGDEISLPVTLRNYTDHSIALPVTAKPADWVSLLTSAKVQATVSANGTTPLVFGLRANRSVEAGSLQITATNAHEGDAVEKTVRVHPDGEPRAVTAAGLLIERSTRLTLDVPADAIPVSIHAELRLYPNLGAHVLDAMKAVLERPYGCAEQTISSSYPSLLYLELVKASHTDKASNDPFAIEAQTYLQLGHDRLADYFDASGGLTYWGGNDHTPDPALTAYAIEFLTEAAPYIAVDRDQITGAIKWLLASQQADGGWKPRYGDTSSDLNLYIAEVLAQTVSSDTVGKGEPKEFHDRVAHAIVSATSRASTSATAVHAPYANALRLRLAERSPGEASTVARLRAELASTAVRDRNGAHWTPLGYSPFYGWGHAGELETTAVVLAALRQGTSSAAESALANDALLFLLRNQDRYGIWYSGQATVRVLQALLPVAIEQAKSSAATQSFQLTVNGGPVGGSEAEGLHIDPQLIEAPRSIDLTALLRPGANELLFTAAGDASLASVEATASFYVPWQGDDASVKTQTGSDAGLDFGYRCAADDAVAGKPIDCTVNARRFGSESYGMMLAEVGLPPGAEVDRSSLASLLDSWTISRYELQPDRIVFYLWSPGASGSHFSFRFIPRYAVRAKAAPATLTDYYNPDLKVVLSPQLFTIKGGARP